MSQIRNHDVCWCVLVRISSGSQTSLKPEDVITSCCWGQPPAKPNAGRAHNSSTYTMSQPTREEIHKMWWWPDAEGFHKVHPFTTAFTICFPHSKQKPEGPEGPADYSVSNLYKATWKQSGSQYCKATPNVLYASYCRESVVLACELKRS